MKTFFTLIGALLLGSSLAQADVVEVKVQTWSNGGYVDAGKPFQTEVTKNADGSYTFANLLNSGAPASFTYDTPGSDGCAQLKMVGSNLDTSETWPYLLNTDGSYAVCAIYPLSDDGEITYIYSPYIADTDYYSWVYPTTLSDGRTQLEGAICITGWTDPNYANYSNWYYLQFDFVAPSETSALENIAVDADAPVEYFNLQGVRVENPSNGLFIRRQGSAVSKVIIK